MGRSGAPYSVAEKFFRRPFRCAAVTSSVRSSRTSSWWPSSWWIEMVPNAVSV